MTKRSPAAALVDKGVELRVCPGAEIRRIRQGRGVAGVVRRNEYVIFALKTRALRKQSTISDLGLVKYVHGR